MYLQTKNVLQPLSKIVPYFLNETSGLQGTVVNRPLEHLLEVQIALSIMAKHMVVKKMNKDPC